MRGNGQRERTRNTKQLIEAMRNKDHLVPAGIMEESVIIWAHGVAIPVDQENFGGDKAEESIDVQDLFKFGEPPRWVRFARCLHQIREIGAILRVVSGIDFERFRNIASGAAVIKIAFGRWETALHELFVGPFDENKQTPGRGH